MEHYEPLKKPRMPLKLNLQLFSEPGDGGGDGGQGEGDKGTGADGGQQKVTFTPEQQGEVDRIIGERLNKAQTKWEKDHQAKLDEYKTEADKLAKMNAEDKAKYEKQKHEDALTKREGEITRRELRATALETLAEKGLPKALVDILNFSDADSTSKSIESVEKAFRDSVELAVNDRLKGTPPKGGSGGSNPAAAEISKIFGTR